MQAQQMNVLDKKRNEEYKKFVENLSPLQNTWKSLLVAGIIGGLICCLTQVFFDIASMLFPSLSKDTNAIIATLCIVFLTIMFTGFGVFDKLAYYGGGGTFLPITGFANSIASAAIEYKSEGIIFGMSAKFFFIAGPVVVSGITVSFFVGIIYWILQLCGVTF